MTKYRFYPTQLVYCVDNTGVKDFIEEWGEYKIISLNFLEEVYCIEIEDKQKNRHFFNRERFKPLTD